MTQPLHKKRIFFGCPMDCDEKYDSIVEKHHSLKTAQLYDDPLDGVMDYLGSEDSPYQIHKMYSINVPPWLGPWPGPEDRQHITTENFISFIDSDGCRKISVDVRQFVADKILPHIPCMVGIDHSVTGGIYTALADHYGRNDISLVVIDSHTDAIPMSALAGAVHFDMETNPDSLHDPDDPFLYNRPDSYNASSFIHHLLKEKVVAPKNLYLIGVSDYPEKKALRIKDRRMKDYTGAYTTLKQKGVRFVTRQECERNPKKLTGFINGISTPYVYVSVDMDIGANNALDGVRFRNWTGLNEDRIYKIADCISSALCGKVSLAGMDICEIDPRRAGEISAAGKDRTYEIAANLIRKIAFGD